MSTVRIICLRIHMLSELLSYKINAFTILIKQFFKKRMTQVEFIG